MNSPAVAVSAAALMEGVPTPLERLQLPSALSGRQGSNRAPAKSARLAADDDLAAVAAWLAPYVDSPATLSAYRREVERLILWSVLQRGTALSSLTHEDLLAYERFLSDPQPAGRWVLTGKKKLARGHPDWRPFAGPLSPLSVRHALVVLNALFAWLTDAGYLAGNPLSLARRRRRAPSAPRNTRYLSHDLWDVVKAAVEAMPSTTKRERLHAARCRWLLSVMYLGGLRASEVLSATMGAFYCRPNSLGAEQWWLVVEGKGEKTRKVPATDELIAELARYRRAHELPATPFPGESRPMVLPLIGREKSMSRSALHQILKEVFGMAAERLRARGPEFEAQATMLAGASAHWLRHTAGTHMTDEQVDLRHVRDTLGHASIATTSVYLHTEDDARHAAIQERHHIRWSTTPADETEVVGPKRE